MGGLGRAQKVSLPGKGKSVSSFAVSMGNKNSPAQQMPSKAFEFEYISGKCLLQGIRKYHNFLLINYTKLFSSKGNNSSSEVAAAIEKARKEFAKPVGGRLANEAGYTDMVDSMLKYLTKKYDIGEGQLFLSSPIDYCDKLHSHEAKKCIEDNLAKLKASKEFERANDAMKKEKGVKAVKTQDTQRVQLAKDRLKGFLNDKNNTFIQ